MTVFNSPRRLSECVLRYDPSYNADWGTLKQATGAALGAAELAARATLQDGLCLPCQKTADNEYTAINALSEANVDALLIGPQARLLNAVDNTGAAMSWATATVNPLLRQWTFIDLFSGVILREDCFPANDLADTAYTAATLITALKALGVRFIAPSATFVEQTT